MRMPKCTTQHTQCTEKVTLNIDWNFTYCVASFRLNLGDARHGLPLAVMYCSITTGIRTRDQSSVLSTYSTCSIYCEFVVQHVVQQKAHNKFKTNPQQVHSKSKVLQQNPQQIHKSRTNKSRLNFIHSSTRPCYALATSARGSRNYQNDDGELSETVNV